jgi:hypothetical protein
LYNSFFSSLCFIFALPREEKRSKKRRIERKKKEKQKGLSSRWIGSYQSTTPRLPGLLYAIQS